MVHIFNRFIHSAPALKPYRHAARWIPLGINPFANLTAVFFTGLEEEIEVEEEDVTEPSEMYVYAHLLSL